jgi:hypothetical protein
MSFGGAKCTPAEVERREPAAVRRASTVEKGEFGSGSGLGDGLKKDGRGSLMKEKRRRRLLSSERRGDEGTELSREATRWTVRSRDPPRELTLEAVLVRWREVFFLEKKERMPGRKVCFWRERGETSSCVVGEGWL